MKAIVYTSGTGFTKRYAEALSATTGLPCYSLEQAPKNLQSGDSVIYMGWLMAGSIKGLNKAKRHFKVVAAAAVGMQPENADIKNAAAERYHMQDIPLFYLRGGYSPEKTHGTYKVMMNAMGKAVTAGLKKKDAPTQDEAQMAKAFSSGSDFWDEAYLTPLIEWYNSQK